MQRAIFVVIVAAILSCQWVSSEQVKDPPLSDWAALAKFRPPSGTVQGLTVFVHGLKGGLPFARGSNVHYDYYSVKISKLPDGVTSLTQLFDTFREKLMGDNSEVIDTKTCKFSPMDAKDRTKWADNNNPVSALIHIDMFHDFFGRINVNVDDGAVVCTKYQRDENHSYWYFTTVFTIRDGKHPVSGTREFGFKKEGSDIIAYTRGVDRLTGYGDRVVNGVFMKDVTFNDQVKTWESFQRKTCEFINKNNGKCDVLPKIALRQAFDSFWSQLAVTCYNSVEDGKVIKVSGDCSKTNMVMPCGKNSECKPSGSNPCPKKCACGGRAGVSGYVRVNICQCVDTPPNDKFCDPYEDPNLLEMETEIHEAPFDEHLAPY